MKSTARNPQVNVFRVDLNEAVVYIVSLIRRIPLLYNIMSKAFP